MRFRVKYSNFLRWSAKPTAICFPPLCWLLGLLLCVVPVQAQQTGLEGNGRRVLTALRLGEVEFIQLDGNLDEPAWDRAVPATDFLQRDPLNGQPATLDIQLPPYSLLVFSKTPLPVTPPSGPVTTQTGQQWWMLP